MSDLDIEIRVATNGAVAELDKVTGAAAKTESSFAALAQKLSDEEHAAKEARLTHAALATDTIGLGAAFEKAQKEANGFGEGIAKMLKESGKGQAMQSLHGIAIQLGDGLKEASHGAFDMGNAMIGLQVAGPVGAVVGGFAGAIHDLSGELPGANELLEHHRDAQIVAGKAAADTTKLIEAQGAVLLGYAQDASLLNTSMHSLAGGFHDVAAAAASVPDWLVRGLGADAWDPATLRKKLTDINNGGAYIGGLGDLGRVGAGSGAGGAYQSALLHQAAPDDNSLEWSWESWQGKRGRFDVPKSPEFSVTNPMFGGLNAGETAGMQKDDLNFMDITSQIDDADAALRKWNQDLDKSQASADALLAHLQPVEDFLVTLATTGEFSWKHMIDSMIADLARFESHELFRYLKGLLVTDAAPVQALGLAGLGGGLSGAVDGGAHAFGGSYVAPGSGGQDSVTVVSRVTPGERIDYTPPGEAPGAGMQPAAPPQPVTVQVVDNRDPRAIFASDDFRRAVVQVVLDSKAVTLRRQ